MDHSILYTAAIVIALPGLGFIWVHFGKINRFLFDFFLIGLQLVGWPLILLFCVISVLTGILQLCGV